tara:strand:- start:3087 stop:3302 length:216 start_codon:yes stop_codon:yes gene_type:complete
MRPFVKMGVNLIKGAEMDLFEKVVTILLIVLCSFLSGYTAYNLALIKTCKIINTESRYIDGECVRVIKNDQ